MMQTTGCLLDSTRVWKEKSVVYKTLSWAKKNQCTSFDNGCRRIALIRVEGEMLFMIVKNKYLLRL